MRVLHVIPSVSPKRGGPSKAVIEMVAALRAHGVDAEIATTNDDEARLLNVPLGVLSQHQGVPVRFFHRYQAPINSVREFSVSWEFRQWLKAHIADYDLLHVHAIFSFTSSYAMSLARAKKIPYIVRPIGQLQDWSLQQSAFRKRTFLTLFERRNIVRASAIHFTAESEQQQSVAMFPALQPIAQVVPLGIQPVAAERSARAQLCRDHNIPAEHTVLLFLSRLHPKKGLELLLHALTKSDASHWHLLIAGGGDDAYVSNLKALVEELGIANQCSFLGHQSGIDKRRLLSGADVFTLTSYSENFGIAALEALAHGTPTLLSDGVALSEFVQQHRLGWVCSTDVSSIQDALNNCLSSLGSDANSDASTISTTTLQHFGWPQIASRLRDLYQQVITK